MNNVKIQEIKSNQQGKYEEIIEYLKQDNRYWLENDKWDLTKEFFIGIKIYNSRYIDFSYFKNEYIKNEVKYYLLFYFKKQYIKKTHLLNVSYKFNHMGVFFEKYYQCVNSFIEINNKKTLLIKWENYLVVSKINTNNSLRSYSATLNSLYDFITNFYDDREETEKDIWNCKKIKGAKYPATGRLSGNVTLNFTSIPLYYREEIKRYFKTRITKRSYGLNEETLKIVKYFFSSFYSNGYTDGFIENLTRQDIENYLYWVNNDFKNTNKNCKSKFISYIRTFLEYIQIAQYDKAPKKEVAFLLFQDDIPKREHIQDQLRRIKFIPEPILKQLDNNIMELDRPQFIPIYILLRETGWRGTDILNLRYHNCLEQIWNSKEQQYNYYLCGEITKTGIAQLKIPIRDKVAEMVQKSIDKAKELSDDENNPNQYLFNTYESKLKGRPLSKAILLHTIWRLIEKKDIRDANGELYHFRLHGLRHTRAKEYVEQGMGISIIQQILGHQSLQMTVHYATVSENVLYEKWKNTEDLELFKVDTKTNELEKVDLTSDTGENLIRYEYVKKNLDAVRVPFGVCFKASKLPCKQQMNHCLTCASFCTTTENIPEYEKEIEHVKKQIDISERLGRELWAEKNKTYLRLLEDTLIRIKEQKIIHKNGRSREEV